MFEFSQICKYELELIQNYEDFNSNRLLRRVNFFCYQNESCKNRKIFSNSLCTYNCLKNISNIDKLDEIIFYNEQFTISFKKNQSEMLKELSNFLKKVTKLKFKKMKFNSSCLDYFKCQKAHQLFINRIFGKYPGIGLLNSDPLKAFIELRNEIEVSNALIKKNKSCKKCLMRFLKNLQKIELFFKKLKILDKYLNLNPLERKESLERIYSKIFQIKITQHEVLTSEFIEKNKVISQYIVEPYLIEIYNTPNREESIFNYSRCIKLNDIPNDIIKNINLFDEKMNFFKLNELIRYKLREITKFLKLNYKSLNENTEKIAKIICFESIGLTKVIPLLLDDHVEEIYLDEPKSNIYIDHSEFGRCSTPIKLNNNDIENFKTRIRLENNSLFDYKHPFLKTDLNTDYFNVRVSCTISPLAIDGFNFSIRKLRKKTFSIIEILNLNTISIDAAAYLCFLLFHKQNILVIGAPGSGKTTLINSLDILTPKNWRKIYLEDVIESISQYSYGNHQLRFHVASNPKENDFFSKSAQVRESLHRTPDMIFIGELIHKETIKAFFFLLKAGLRCGLGTCHGESPELIIQRWIEDDEIPHNSIKNLDVIVQMAKTKFGRRVVRIAEILNSKDDMDNFKIINTFLRDPKTDSLNANFNSFEELYNKSPIINKIKNILIESISINDFNEEILTYINFLNLLKNHGISELNDISLYINKFWLLKRNLEINQQFSFSKLKSNLGTLFL